MHIGVIGLGYVGLSLLKSIPEHHTITGIRQARNMKLGRNVVRHA